MSRILPLNTAGHASIYQNWFQRGPLRVGRGLPGSAEHISVKCKFLGASGVTWVKTHFDLFFNILQDIDKNHL